MRYSLALVLCATVSTCLFGSSTEPTETYSWNYLYEPGDKYYDESHERQAKIGYVKRAGGAWFTDEGGEVIYGQLTLATKSDWSFEASKDLLSRSSLPRFEEWTFFSYGSEALQQYRKVYYPEELDPVNYSGPSKTLRCSPTVIFGVGGGSNKYISL